MSALRADVPLRTDEIAAILGWDTRRTATWLDGLAERDPSIVVRVRGRRMTTLASLRRVAPDVARRFASDEDVENMSEELATQKRELDDLAEQFRMFRQKSSDWYRGLSQRTNAIEKKLRERP